MAMFLHRNTTLSSSPSHFSALGKKSNNFFPRIWVNLRPTSVNTNDHGAPFLCLRSNASSLSPYCSRLRDCQSKIDRSAPLADINLYSPECSCLPTFFRRFQNRRTRVPNAPRPAPHRHARRRAHVRRPARRVVEHAYKADGLTVACQIRCCYPGPSPSPFLFFSCSILHFLYFFLLLLEGGSVTQDGLAVGQTV